MPKSAKFDESRLAEGCKAVLAQKKPKLAKIAREFGVSRTTLSDRVKKARSPTKPAKSLKNALEPYQEKALTDWIVQMCSWNLPPTAQLIEAWANQALARTGHDNQVSKMWAYPCPSVTPTPLLVVGAPPVTVKNPSPSLFPSSQLISYITYPP